MKYASNHISNTLGECDKIKRIKIKKNMTGKINLFDFTPYEFDRHVIRRPKAIIKKMDSRFIKLLPYKNIKTYGVHLKSVDTLSKQFYDKVIKYNLIFKNRFFYSQKKLWLCTYGLNSLFYETFIEINRKRKRSINHKTERLSTETSNKKYGALEDFGISNLTCLWILMLRSQLLSEIFKCSVYGHNQNTFKIQKLLSKNWSMQILIFCLLSECGAIPFCTSLRSISIDSSISPKKKNRQVSQINYALYQKSKSEVTNSNMNISEQNDYVLYKFRRLFYKYFLYVVFQPEWETKNNSFCYNIRPGTTIYDCLDSMFQFYHAHDKTKHKFIFNTKMNFLSNIFHPFRFIESHRKFIQKKTHVINNTKRSLISIKQNVFNRNFNNAALYITLLSFLNKKYPTFDKKTQFYISLPLVFFCGSPLSLVTQMKNRIFDSQRTMHSLKVQNGLSPGQQSECSNCSEMIFENRIENQRDYKSNLQNRLIFKERLDDSSSIYNKIMLENLETQIVDFTLKKMYKEKKKTEGKNQKQLQSLSHFSSKPLSFFKKNSLLLQLPSQLPPHTIYKFHVENMSQKITFASYPLGIYSKKSFCILLHRVPFLKIHSEVQFNILQTRNRIKKNAFYNESDVVFEVMSQKQKRALYNQTFLDMTSPCMTLTYFFNYLLIQYGSEIIYLSSNKLTMNQCIEFFNRGFSYIACSELGIKNKGETIISNKNVFSDFNEQSQIKNKKNILPRITPDLDGHNRLNLEGFSIFNSVQSKQIKEKILPRITPHFTHDIEDDIYVFFTRKKNINSLDIELRHNRIRSRANIEHKLNSNKHAARKKNLSILLVPSRSNVKNYLQQIKQVIKKSKTDAQDFLIDKLSYKINLWCYSYRIVSNKKIFYYCDHMILKWLWRWSCRRHPNKNKNWILNKYFHSIQKKNKKHTNQSRWNFCVYKKSTKSFYCLPRHSQIKLVRHLKIPEHYSIYDENWKYWLRRLS